MPCKLVYIFIIEQYSIMVSTWWPTTFHNLRKHNIVDGPLIYQLCAI